MGVPGKALEGVSDPVPRAVVRVPMPVVSAASVKEPIYPELTSKAVPVLVPSPES
jgi:hypothetical protein